MKTYLAVGLGLLALLPGVSAGRDPAETEREPVKISGNQKAPEFADIAGWINSKPLKMADLKGKVVLVHFMTFGWINCIHDYPWYKDIQEKYKDRGVVLIGIHTPETEGEKDIETVRKKIKQAGLIHAIAVDNKTTMWQRYSNQYWPSVYLFDKKGIARWGWAGELGWNGARGRDHMRKKIDDLLRE